MHEAGQVHAHYYGAVLGAQQLIDDYALWLRESLSEWGRAECEDLLHITEPRAADLARLKKLESATSTFRRPLPSVMTTPRTEEVQTPIQLLIWRSFLTTLTDERRNAESQKSPALIRKAQPGCQRLIMQSFVLANEYVSLLDLKKLTSVNDPIAHHPHDLMVEGRVPETEQQELDQVGAVRVGTAILYEPLRIYTQAANQFKELRDDGIEALAGSKSRRSALKKWRNIVFHVARNDIDPDEVDSRVVGHVKEFDPGMLLERLAAFYWRWPQ